MYLRSKRFFQDLDVTSAFLIDIHTSDGFIIDTCDLEDEYERLRDPASSVAS
ncbi:MAG: hypothetical protein J07HQW1_01041 [Haloquadratum walsbyi J07HQW1]|jgi:hypothetical protein|uniref:Uncharacterized protein n=1 Tax=Haloquadratum walsbyi J07HQW1 TaxID=1238424 RepID=U1N3A1_9EURY|nr:MAG: hypothetical protein J07HQW1_01041 [Haloquadratum walsbyi J07HQW1]